MFKQQFRALLRVLLKALFRVQVQGDAASFSNPRTLIVANHESFIDGLLIGLLMPVDAVFVVHTQIAARPLFAFSLRFVRHLVVDSNSPLAIKQIVKLVETGQPVVIFPEGRITKTGALMKVTMARLLWRPKLAQPLCLCALMAQRVAILGGLQVFIRANCCRVWASPSSPTAALPCLTCPRPDCAAVARVN